MSSERSGPSQVPDKTCGALRDPYKFEYRMHACNLQASLRYAGIKCATSVERVSIRLSRNVPCIPGYASSVHEGALDESLGTQPHVCLAFRPSSKLGRVGVQ